MDLVRDFFCLLHDAVVNLYKPDNPLPYNKNVVLDGPWDFVQVSFAYPSRPTLPILEDFNMRLMPNCMTALVGRSGFGKSTIMGLMQQLYAPMRGRILVRGVDLDGMRTCLSVILLRVHVVCWWVVT